MPRGYQVDLSELVWRDATQPRSSLHDRLGHEHGLRGSEPSEGSEVWEVGLAAEPTNTKVLDCVGVYCVKHGPVHHLP